MSVGDEIQVQNFVTTGADINGTQIITAIDTGNDTFTYNIGGTTDPGTITHTEGCQFIFAGTGVAVTTNYSKTSNTTLQVTSSSHGLEVGDDVSFTGLTANSQSYLNTNYLITAKTTNTFDVTIAETTGSITGDLTYFKNKSGFTISNLDSTTGTPKTFFPYGGEFILDDSAVSEVTCGCRFSDPNTSTNNDYILIASNANVKAINTQTEESFTIPLQTVSSFPETIPVNADMIQLFNQIVIFRDGQAPLVNTKFFVPITLSQVTTSGSNGTTTVTTNINHNIQTGDFVKILNVPNIVNTVVIGEYQVTRVNETQFSYTASSGTDNGDADLSASNPLVSPMFHLGGGFTSSNTTGTFEQPAILTCTAFSITDGVATATVSNKLDIDDEFTVVSANSSTLTNKTKFRVSERVGYNGITKTSTGFKFLVDLPDLAEITSGEPVFIGRQSVGGGFIHMPRPRFGILHQNRLVVPYETEPDGTDRFIKDEIVFSDIADLSTYDPIFNKFRFNAGASDFIVGLLSFADNQLVVLNRNSIHIASLVGTFDLRNSAIKMVSDEVGCLARKTIQQVGNQILFLSDNGVYALSFLDRYNLRGTEIPLSEPITKFIQQINLDKAHLSVSAYFNNRYYVSVPMNVFIDNRSSDEAGFVQGTFINRIDAINAGIPEANIELNQQEKNNVILIYNFLNKQWESIDTFSDVNFDVLDMIVAGNGNNRGVYVFNSQGGIHRLEDNTKDGGYDELATTLGTSTGTEKLIDSRLLTRQFNSDNMSRKKFRDFEIHCASGKQTADFSIKVNAVNPDKTQVDLKTLNHYSSIPINNFEDLSIRGKIGNIRAYSLDMEIKTITGRPNIQKIKVGSSVAFRQDKIAE